MAHLDLLLKQLEHQNKIIERCQLLLTVAVIACIIAICIMLFIIFKGKGEFTKDKVVIGDVKDKNELHRDVMELKRVVKEMKENQKLNYAKN